MPLFDLGTEVGFDGRFDVGLAQARRLAHEILRSYEPMGYAVAATDEGHGVRATITDDDGTAIAVEIALSEDGDTAVAIRLSGQVFVGGMKGMFATDARVQQVAQSQLADFVNQTFDGVARENEVENEPENEPEPEPAPKPASGPDRPRTRFRDTMDRLMRGDLGDASPAEQDAAIREAIKVAAIASAAVTIQPIPLADLALVTPIQVTLVQVIGSIRGQRLDGRTVVELLGTLGTGMVTQHLVMAAAKFVPFAGWAVSMSTAYAMTWSVGQVADHYFANGRRVPDAELRAMFKSMFDRVRKEKQQEHKRDASLKERLEQLVEARRAGLIDDDEFAQKKEQILQGF